MMRAARPHQLLPKQGRAAAFEPLRPLMQTQTHRIKNEQCCSLKGSYLPYVDINPHKSKPKWLAYVGLALLLIATIAITLIVLTKH